MSSRTITECRSCGSAGLQSILDLGLMPHSDGLRRPDQLELDEPKYPLELVFCPHCGLVQINEEVDPEVLFGDDYPYFSSFSDSLLKHSKKNVDGLCEWRGLGAENLVVELASNDGYLLQYFQQNGVEVLGIDPAPGPAKAAQEKGVPTLNTFFTKDLADQLVAEGKRADVVVGNNVMAHVPDLNGFVAGIAALLTDTGTTSIEAPYVVDLIDHCEFDTIYHEHLCYFSVTAVKALFERHGLHLNRVVHLPIHGGSLRYHGGKTAEPDGSVEEFLKKEKELGVTEIGFYEAFGAKVRALRDAMQQFVAAKQAEGKRFAAYGAAAKGAIMLNYVGLDESKIEFVVDRNVHKQGRFMPGYAIPIHAPEHLLESMPDYTVLLPWNLEKEIIGQQLEYLEKGGKFLIPVPTPREVSLEDVQPS
ncbi:MAG: class I SAM-dependent methyltransferase [Planctomycetota bacterium]